MRKREQELNDVWCKVANWSEAEIKNAFERGYADEYLQDSIDKNYPGENDYSFTMEFYCEEFKCNITIHATVLEYPDQKPEMKPITSITRAKVVAEEISGEHDGVSNKCYGYSGKLSESQHQLFLKYAKERKQLLQIQRPNENGLSLSHSPKSR